MEEVETYEVEIETPEGRGITGRITGKLIAEQSSGPVHGVSAFLTEDERVLIYDENKQQIHDVSDDPAAAFEDWFAENAPDAYVDAMEAIGERAVIDL